MALFKRAAKDAKAGAKKAGKQAQQTVKRAAPPKQAQQTVKKAAKTAKKVRGFQACQQLIGPLMCHADTRPKPRSAAASRRH